MVWTIIEPGLAIVASSLATIRPLLRAMRVRGFESTEDSNKHSRDQALQQIPQSPRRLLPRSPYGLDDITLTTNATTTMEPAVGGVTATTRLGEGAGKSEVYVIQGQIATTTASATGDDDGERRSTWSEERSEDDRSLVQIHDLEAQNQEKVPTGIGDGGPAGRGRMG